MKTFLTTSVAFLINITFNLSSSAQIADALMLTVSSGSYSDQTAIRFLDDATDYFDSQFDAYKARNRGNTPNFCSFVNNQTYAINALNGGGLLQNVVVPLNLEVAFSGQYKINGTQIGLFSEFCIITLIDKATGITHDFNTNPDYTFQFNVGDPIDRFEVLFNVEFGTQSFTSTGSSTTANVFASKNDVNDTKIFSKDGEISIDLGSIKSSAVVNISDMMGRAIVSTTIASSSANWVFTPRRSELYIVSLLINGILRTEKVYVQ
jgi:hypothetical protein